MTTLNSAIDHFLCGLAFIIRWAWYVIVWGVVGGILLLLGGAAIVATWRFIAAEGWLKFFIGMGAIFGVVAAIIGVLFVGAWIVAWAENKTCRIKQTRYD